MKLLFDNNMSPHIARGLHVLFNGEHKIVALRDHFGRGDIPDMEWIDRLGKEGGWCVVSQDVRITRNPVERDAFLNANLIGFFLAPAVRKAPLHVKTARLLQLWAPLQKIADSVESGLYEVPIRGDKLKALRNRRSSASTSRLPRPRPLLLHETRPVPIAALEGDLAVADLEEAAAAQTLGVAPFEDRPGTVLEQVLDDADHFGMGEVVLEHGADGRATMDRRLHHLVVDGILMIEPGKRGRVAAIERLDPCPHQRFWRHGLTSPALPAAAAAGR